MTTPVLFSALAAFALAGCAAPRPPSAEAPSAAPLSASQPSAEAPSASMPPTATARIPVLIDTDANNELDDQHALAYALFSADALDVVGITTNRTSGGPIALHDAEARRVVALAGSTLPVVTGADSSYTDILPHVAEADFDGKAAVDLIIAEARRPRTERLVLVPIGKLTNVALALARDPGIAPLVRVVWLGSNYPAPGEHNQQWDEPALNAVLDSPVDFEIVTVRYTEASGSDAVRVTAEMIAERMAGRGPRVATPVEGRNGGTFSTFGDYAVDLFGHIDLYGTPPSRALFDVVAIAVIKDPTLGRAETIPAPHVVAEAWVERPDNPRRITVWEDFDSPGILDDFFGAMQTPVLTP